MEVSLNSIPPALQGLPKCRQNLRFVTSRKPRSGVNSALDNALWNDIDPQYTIQKEKPEHREIQGMALRGCTIREIAAAMELTPGYVSNILRQPRSRVKMLDEMQKNVDDFKSLLEAERIRNLEVAIEIRDDPEASKRDRLAAVQLLWNRDMGNPNQPFTPPSDIDVTKLSTTAILKQMAAEGLLKEEPPEPTPPSTSPGTPEAPVNPADVQSLGTARAA